MSTTPPIHPLGYENPSSPRRVIFSWNIFLITAAVMLLYGAFFGILVPHMEQVYRDYPTALPGPTVIILKMSHHMVPLGEVTLACIPLALAVVVPLVLPSPTGTAARRAHRGTARVIRVLLMLALLAMMLAVMMPMFSLITSLTSTGK